MVTRAEMRLRPPSPEGEGDPPPVPPGDFRGRTWVTRAGIHVDRLASAWLIQRFIDPEARFKFVRTTGYRHKSGELRFDMFDAEYTHVGDRCTFEVLLDRFGLTEAALQEVSEIIHDLDLKDSKFARAETDGIGAVIAGIVLAHADDDSRLERGSALFDDLYQSLCAKTGSSRSGARDKREVSHGIPAGRRSARSSKAPKKPSVRGGRGRPRGPRHSG